MAGTDLTGRFPCHPTRVARPLAVEGIATEFVLTSCDAGGMTYGILTADVADPVRVDPALGAMAEAARRGAAAASATVVPLTFAGVTPYRGDVRMRFVGRNGDGRTVEESVSLFARGTRIYQATVIGPELPPAAVDPFTAGLHFRQSS